MILGYIRISTSLQDLKNQKNSINEFARKNSFIVDKFIEVEISSRKNQNERKINEVFATLQENDILIITELSRLGRSLSEILKINSFSSAATSIKVSCAKLNNPALRQAKYST